MNSITLPEIGHIGYLVESADTFAKNLVESFNFTDYVVYDFVPKKAWCYTKNIYDCKFRIALCSPKCGAKIELVEYISGINTPHEKFIREHGQGIHHIAYYVDNYEEYRSYFQLLPGSEIIFEAEIEDEIMGKRSSFYATSSGYPSVIEISKKIG